MDQAWDGLEPSGGDTRAALKIPASCRPYAGQSRNPCRLSAAHTLDNNCVSYAPVKFHSFHPRPLQKQKAYHWRVFTPANNQTIWPLQWWIIAPAFSYIDGNKVVCPLHQAEFDIPSGKVLCAPATNNICTYPVRTEDDRILVGIAVD